MRAMVAAVHESGKIIQTHQTYAPGLEAVVEAGVDMAQHCAHTGLSRIEDRTIMLMLGATSTAAPSGACSRPSSRAG